MAWEDVPAKLIEYNGLAYANDSDGPASERLIQGFTPQHTLLIEDIEEHRREDFEAMVDYHIAACKNLASSRAWSADTLRRT